MITSPEDGTQSARAMPCSGGSRSVGGHIPGRPGWLPSRQNKDVPAGMPRLVAPFDGVAHLSSVRMLRLLGLLNLNPSRACSLRECFFHGELTCGQVQGQAVTITGASSGIGAALVPELGCPLPAMSLAMAIRSGR